MCSISHRCSAPSTFQFSWISIQDNVICFYCSSPFQANFFSLCTATWNCVAAEAAATQFELKALKTVSLCTSASTNTTTMFYTILFRFIFLLSESQSPPLRRYHSSIFVLLLVLFTRQSLLFSLYCRQHVWMSANRGRREPNWLKRRRKTRRTSTHAIMNARSRRYANSTRLASLGRTRRDNAWARCSVFALVPDLFFVNLFLFRRKIAQHKFAKCIRFCERENWVSALRALTYYHTELIILLLHFVSSTCMRRVSLFVRVTTMASNPSSWMATRFHWICNAAKCIDTTYVFVSSPSLPVAWMRTNNLPMVHSMLFRCFFLAGALCIWRHPVWRFKLKYILVRCRLSFARRTIMPNAFAHNTIANALNSFLC